MSVNSSERMKNHFKSSEPSIGSVVSLQGLENEKFVIGKILKGGMGAVYQLIPVNLAGRTVALKTYQASAVRSQFIKEAELWISLGTNPHIAHALAYMEWQSKPAVIADWYERSLADVDITKWPSSRIVTFVQQLIDGLRYALDYARIIHQDVKPANVLIDDDNAPRLTDFGMARFAAPGLSGLRSVEDLRPTMGAPVSLGPVGGTPLYMAPELFSGAPPSVRTDIFSLGVTLYEALTRQHPFFGPETGYRFRPVVREAPLGKLIDQHGSQMQALARLVRAALRLNPESRPHSYDHLASEAGLQSLAASLRPTDQVADAVAQAAFLRAQGRYDEAQALLQDSIKERPTDPVLLNSYAILLLAAGRKLEAWDMWRMGVESLRLTSGRHGRKLYLDPAANLAGQMICENEFSQADELLRTALDWWKGQSGSVVDLIGYPEFGWWYLYNGQFQESYRHISTMYKFRAPDEASLLWITLAAWLSGNFREYARQLAEFYLSLENLKLPTALSACAVAASCADALAAKLINVGTRGHEAEISEIAKDLGLTFQAFRRPLDHWVCKTIVRSADMRFTGGKHSGIIR